MIFKNLYRIVPVVLLLVFTTSRIHAQHQIHVDHAPQNGVMIEKPGNSGLIIDSAQVGAQILRTNVTGLAIGLSGQNGIYVESSGAHGIFVDSSDHAGILIRKSAQSGLQIVQTDTDGIDIKDVKDNGISIKQAHRGIDISGVNEGVRVSGPGGNGVSVETPFSHGFQVSGAGQNGADIRNTEGHGVNIRDAGGHGIQVRETAQYGISIDETTQAGIRITNAGAQGISIDNPASNGIYVANAQANGLLVDSPDGSGVHIKKSGLHGIVTDSAGGDGLVINAPSDDGINIINPVDDGIDIVGAGNDGIHVNGAEGFAAQLINSASSPKPSVLISHADDDEVDLLHGGDARIEAEGNYHIQLDGADDLANATFMIHNSSGLVPLIATEDGDLGITGHLSKGSGSFKIDHPLDPKNKYLYHSFVESPDMMNVYNGNIVLDHAGTAIVEMPKWFESLNRDFRYQLTPIGTAADLYVSQEMEDGSFGIAGGSADLKVSWQVTGIRQDRYANKHRLEVEVEKEEGKKGTFLHPEVWETTNLDTPQSNNTIDRQKE